MKVLLAQSCPTLVTPWTVAFQAPLSMEFSRQEYRSGLPFPSPGDLSNPWIEPGSPTLQADSLPSEPPGKPKNTGVGSVSLCQGNFPTQESNQGLLHRRWILYQLSYLGSPSTKLSSSISTLWSEGSAHLSDTGVITTVCVCSVT